VIDLPDDDVDAVTKMIEFLYRAEYTDLEENCYLQHARIFAIATKYGMPDLSKLASKNYREQGQKHWDPTAFLDSIPAVYELTSEDVRGLRNAARQCARMHYCSLTTEKSTKPSWRKVCLEFPEFALDMLDSFAQSPLIGRCSICGHCQKLEASQFRCCGCGRGGAYLDEETMPSSRKFNASSTPQSAADAMGE
jgi:hypothetical protein